MTTETDETAGSAPQKPEHHRSLAERLENLEHGVVEAVESRALRASEAAVEAGEGAESLGAGIAAAVHAPGEKRRHRGRRSGQAAQSSPDAIDHPSPAGADDAAPENRAR